MFVPLKGINVHIAHGGYTGEDGFEVSLKLLSPFGCFPCPKLTSVEPSVKAAMLKLSHILSLTATLLVPSHGLCHVQSGSSLDIESSPHKGATAVPDYHHHHHHHPTLSGATPPGAQFFSPRDAMMTTATHHSYGMSVNMVVPLWHPKLCISFSASSGGTLDLSIAAATMAACGKAFLPMQSVSLLMGKPSLELKVDVVKKLQLLLQNEVAR
jgi:hypothetical protein